MSYIGREPTVGNFQVCDAISVVNNQAAYTMQVSSVNVIPETSNHMLVSLNGILQAPGSSFTVAGSTITFASALVTNDVINFIQILGSVLDLGVPSDDTVSIAKLTATGTKNSTTFLRGDNTFATPAGGVNTPTWSATMGSNQSISANTTTKLNFNTEQWDVGTGFNTSNYNYTVPSGGAGKYVMTATVTLHNAASGNRVSCNIYKGGSALALKNEYSSQTQDSQSTVSFSAILSAGDVLDVRASTDQGSPQFDAANSFFSGFKIIE